MASHTCLKCGKTMDEKNFYTYRDGSKTELCKKCLTMHIDNFDPETFLWLLEKMDVPYIEEEWNSLRDKAFAKNPYKMNGMSVFGKYLSKMKLRQWKDDRWADTEKLKKEKEKMLEANKIDEKVLLEKHEELKNKLEAGEIGEAEYKTLVDTSILNKEMEKSIMDSVQVVDVSASTPGPRPSQSSSTVIASPPPKNIWKEDGIQDNPYDEKYFMSEEEMIDLGAELTNEDKLYLAMKWGRLYRPNEWVELEKKYTEMKNSFDIQDSDTDGTLILICKTYLKMNKAIDASDMDAYQKLSRVYDSLRKSAKFTAAQNKEQRGEFIDSVGELVAYCEKNGGKIPRYDTSVDYDIVDKVIKDLKTYTKTLIYEDTALARQIEDYIQKREYAEAIEKDKKAAREKGLDHIEITDEDYRKHFEMLEEAKKQDEQIYYNNEPEKES